MGRRGPAPKPTAQKIAEGNRGKRPLNTREPQPRTDAPRCPNWLDKIAKAAWAQLVPQLREMGVLTTIDQHALAAYCQSYARWRKAEEFIQRHGEVFPIKDDDGNLKYLQQVPQVAIARNLLQMLNRYQQEFGLTPSARTRIHVPIDGKVDDIDPDDPTLKYLRRRRERN